MKKILLILSIIGLLGTLLSSFFLLQSGWSFSLIFKSLLIFCSLFVTSVAIRNSDLNKIILVVSLVCFGSTIIILSNTNLYLMLWNFVLTGHILLIGYSLYKETKTTPPSIFQNITAISIIVSIAFFAIVILLKSQNELIFTCLFFLIILSSILLVINKITSALKRT
jgi:hypothetical protein